VTFFGIGMAGFYYISSIWYYYVIFICIGLLQSVCFPAFISVIAAWFSKKNRGLATMAFCTCVNIGNIAGAQIAA
jgi:sugar phosphate permease